MGIAAFAPPALLAAAAAVSTSRFLITGLPRSRTSWLSNLFTYGSCFCFHDGLQYGAAGLSQKMDQVARENPRLMHIGNSDSGVPYALGKAHGASKVIVVKRDRADAEESFFEYFRSQPYPQMRGRLEVLEVRDIFDKFAAALDRLIEDMPIGSIRVVRFEELDRMGCCEDLWSFIAPEEPFCRARWELLNKLRVNPASEKVEVVAWA